MPACLQIAVLEQALHEAHSTIGSLQRHTYDLTRERDLQESRLQARSHDDRRLEVLRQQLTAAFQEELAVSQDNCARFESTVACLTSENQQLQGLLSERDAHINSLTSRHQVHNSCRPLPYMQHVEGHCSRYKAG